MKKLAILVLLILSFPALAGIAHFKYERVSGMNKICFYDYLGSEVAITISAVKLCPLTIKV